MSAVLPLSTAKANARTLCLSSPGCSLDARAGHFLLTIADSEGPPLKLPPLAVRQILVEHGATLRTRAATLALDCAIPVSFFDRTGNLRGHLQPPLPPRVDLRLAQYRAHGQGKTRLALARRILSAKLRACAELIADPGSAVPGSIARSTVVTLRRAAHQAGAAADRDALLGLEGAAARVYFHALGATLPGGLAGRSRRPPRDRWNALLSYGYAVLIRDLAGKLELAGLDPHVGYLHEVGYGGPALALDLAEPLRAPVIDRLVLDLAGELEETDFDRPAPKGGGGGGGVHIGPEAKAAFFRAYEARVRSRDITRTAQPGGSLLADHAASFAAALRDGTHRRWRPPQPESPCPGRP